MLPISIVAPMRRRQAAPTIKIMFEERCPTATRAAPMAGIHGIALLRGIRSTEVWSTNPCSLLPADNTHARTLTLAASSSSWSGRRLCAIVAARCTSLQ
jgi:hypothetical protein